jgi:hypothetical protein
VAEAAGSWAVEFQWPYDLPGDCHAVSALGVITPVAIEPCNAGGAWREPARGASYAVVAPEKWLIALEPLVQLERRRGHYVEVFSVESIFDRFDGGRPTTTAIQEFLRHARATWPAPGLEYVLLVGDATFDPRGHLGVSARQVLPARLIETRVMESASDNRLADLEGDDGVADVCIGRLPVASVAECQAIVAKLLDQESRAGAGVGAARAVVVADQEAEFEWMGRELAATGVLARQNVQLIALGNLGFATAQAALLDAWWSGPALVHYCGHGSRTQWGASGLVTASMVPPVAQNQRFPIVVAMNCLNGFFHATSTPALGEALLAAPGGGAAVFWGPTAVTDSARQQLLAKAFYRALASDRVRTVGQAIREAQRQLAPDPANREVLDTWILLGDPAQPLR